MKHHSKNSKQQVHEFPVWTYEQANLAVPYIRSILRSLREQFLNLQSLQLRAQRLANKPGRPTREQILNQEETAREADRVEDSLSETVDELTFLNIHCVEPSQGVAMIPFVQRDELAWLVFDLFGEQHLTGWRFHHDELSRRRSLDDLQEAPLPNSVIV